MPTEAPNRFFLRSAAGYLSAITLLGIGWAATAWLLDNPVLPPPQAVLVRWMQLWPFVLWPHTNASLFRILSALGAAVCVALPTALVLHLLPQARWIGKPLLYLLYPIPKIALLPVILLLVGIGEPARVFLLWLVLFFQALVALYDGLNSVPAEYLLSLRSLGGRRRHVVRYVLIPAILPQLLSALRVGTATALAVLFFAETFFTSRGLGLFIVDSWMKAAYPDMLAGIVTMATVGIALFALIDLAQRLLCGWQSAGSNRG